MNTKKRDLILILIWPVFASLFSFLIQANIFISMLLFLGVPAAYLSYYNKKFIKKIALFSIASIPIGIVVDYVMEITRGWYLPYSIFGSFRLFGYVTMEQLIWLFLYSYFVVIFYEVFLKKKRFLRLYYPNLKYLFAILTFFLIVFVLFYAFNPSFLIINYFYLKFGITMALIPIVFVLLKFPNLLGKFFKVGAYFFFLSLVYEITALRLGQWEFPVDNQFIGFVEILGTRFPFEELFFWIILGALAVLSYYEFFDDDRT